MLTFVSPSGFVSCEQRRADTASLIDMPAFRLYVPLAALICVLARLQSLQCPLLRPLPMQFVRGKKSKALDSDAMVIQVVNDVTSER
jgi:hypothetical protein